MSRRTAQWVLLALVLALHGGLCVLVLTRGSALWDDSVQYLTLADNLHQHGAYSQQYAAPYLPDTQRTPGYVAWLWLWHNWMPGILLAQHLLLLLSAWGLYKVLSPLYGHTVSRIAACGWALLPYPALMASALLTEALFLPLLVVFACLVLHPRSRLAHWLAIVGTGVALMLVKPLGLVPVAVGLVLHVLVHRRPWPTVLAALSLVACLAPWQYRVWQHTGQWTLSTGGSISTAYGKLGGTLVGPASDSLLVLETDTYLATQSPFAQRYAHTGQAHQEFTQVQGAGRALVQYWVLHPVQAIQFHMLSLWQMAKGTGYGAARLASGNHKGFAWVLAGLQAIGQCLLWASVLGVAWYWRSVPWVVKGLVAIALLLLLAHAAAWADGRYRLPADALLVVPAAWVWGHWYQKMRRPKPSSSLGITG